MNNSSILDIRKIKFIENPNQENFSKLAKKVYTHKEIFDNSFFAKATEKALFIKNVTGLLFISKLYIMLERNIEAEYILSRAYKIDDINNDILYYYFDILCRRKQFGLVSSIGEKLDRSKNDLMYIKSLIKYYILSNNEIELNDLLFHNFEKYKNDEDFVFLAFITAIQKNNYHLTYLVNKTKFRRELFSDLIGHMGGTVKNHFYILITNLLKEIINDGKDC